MRFIWNLYLKALGWSIPRPFPDVRRCVIVVAPHTSSQDVVIGMAVRSVARMKQAHYLAKKELFDGPFGFFFKWTKGVAVDRSASKNLVEQAAAMFETDPDFKLALSPEGTRKKVDKLKTGFYHIARLAQVPIVLAALDYEKKQCIFSEPFFPQDQEQDFKRVVAFFGQVKGKNPELDMRHLYLQHASVSE